MTAFDTDIHVPLVVTGPGVPAGTSSDAMAENVDLAETFAQMGGTTMNTGDGHSLLELMHGNLPGDWRNAILVEHHGPKPDRDDPDEQDRSSGNPPSYEAMRTPRFLYVEYDDGEREFYDLQTDPYELDNLAASLSPAAIGPAARRSRAARGLPRTGLLLDRRPSRRGARRGHHRRRRALNGKIG